MNVFTFRTRGSALVFWKLDIFHENPEIATNFETLFDPMKVRIWTLS